MAKCCVDREGAAMLKCLRPRCDVRNTVFQVGQPDFIEVFARAPTPVAERLDHAPVPPKWGARYLSTNAASVTRCHVRVSGLPENQRASAPRGLALRTWR